MKSKGKPAPETKMMEMHEDKYQKREDADLIMRHAELSKDRGRFKAAMSHIQNAVKVNTRKK